MAAKVINLFQLFKGDFIVTKSLYPFNDKAIRIIAFI